MKDTIVSLLMLLAAVTAQAQITIQGSVFGGARQADVGGHTFVNIGADNHDVIIDKVFGGNDIAGEVGKGYNNQSTKGAIPVEIRTEATNNGINNTYDSFVSTNPEPTTTTGSGGSAVTTALHHLFIGQLFGGGNGDYQYLTEGGKYVVKDASNTTLATSTSEFVRPVLAKTYLELKGGTFGYVYGGGNNATVSSAADICIKNTSIPWNLSGEDGVVNTADDEISDPRLQAMGINTEYFDQKGHYHFSRVFGGNNKAVMAIQPTWHLKDGSIENLYSGGNEGAMTSPTGLLLEIGKKSGETIETSNITVLNVYGGCRKADVRPERGGSVVTEVPTLPEYGFDANYAARVLVRSGHIHNVYGGNDVSGRVYFGNAVGVYTSITGNIFGGGNGSYPYTDNNKLITDPRWGDFYYNPATVFSDAQMTDAEIAAIPEKLRSVKALNMIRPSSGQVSIRVDGTPEKKTVIEGSIFLGGNSATLTAQTIVANPKVELKVGDHVIVDNVFLGNNGEDMVNPDEGGVLRQFRTSVTGSDKLFNSMDLRDADVFAEYMEAVAMDKIPTLAFDNVEQGANAYSSMIGSLFLGGNRGSMTYAGTNDMNFHVPVIIYNKIVGGCNNANIDEQWSSVEHTNANKLNASYKGGVKTALTSTELAANPNKLVLNFNHGNNGGIRMQPMRWQKDENDDYVLDGNGDRQLEWNTISAASGQNVTPGSGTGTATVTDKDRRLTGGNVYGGCYTSGYVNGNVEINFNESLINRNDVFAVVTTTKPGGEAWPAGYQPKLYEDKVYTITTRNSGVILDEQGMDVLGSAFSVFGGGYGADSEIWGNASINVNRGYVFQIFGGGEAGIIGNLADNNTNQTHRDATYSTYINLNNTPTSGSGEGVARGAAGDDPNMAEVEFIYGGAFEGAILGSTHIYLGNGRIFNSFAGSCNADINGHTETYVGRNRAGTLGFPWIRDHIYGGNDLGGRILSKADFTGNISSAVAGMVYNANCPKASSYMEYRQGRVEHIFGGCFGDYDYYTYFNNGQYSFEAYTGSDTHTGSIKYFKPYMENAFVHICPTDKSRNSIVKVFGAGEGISGDRDGDKMQDRSYVLVDISNADNENFANTEVFGAGAFDGVGMRTEVLANASKPVLDAASAVVDLMRGHINAAYGGSYDEGLTRRTVVNVPENSTIKLNKIFGGAYGLSTLLPCDVYESNVNYNSDDAVVTKIYGGNNNERRTIFAKVNISAEVVSDRAKGYQGEVYGAGCGANTWSEYTEVNLNDGAKVSRVYGGGEDGKVFNTESVQAYMQRYKNVNDATAWKKAWSFGDYYTPANDNFDDYTSSDSEFTLLNNALARPAEMDDRETKTYRYNTNVRINEGAIVTRYAYGGGKGAEAIIAGTTYIALLGGTVVQDIYAAGEGGPVEDMMRLADNLDNTFIASSNAYIQGGTVRNVYGGGYEGNVGIHAGAISATTTGDIDAHTHVVVGVSGDNGFLTGNPAVLRNVYGGGEGGSVFGESHVKVYNGHIGFRYTNNSYVEELDDEEEGDNDLDESGNVFGGGYVANSYTDKSYITMYDGTVRGCLYGGGEIGPIGRGSTAESAPAPVVGSPGSHTNEDAKIYKGGETHVMLYGGLVMRDVFGGGRGYDNWGGNGTKFMKDDVIETLDLSSKGYIFGSTEVRIRGGVVGTTENLTKGSGYGNVFGGGNVGYVYSATGTKHGTREGETDLVKGLPRDGGGYFYDVWYDDENRRSECSLSHDCEVIIEPYCLVTNSGGITIGGKSYAQGDYVPIEYLNKLRNKNLDATEWNKVDWESGVTIRNAVFAGGNVLVGSDQVYVNTSTVFGNVTAALRDAYNRDLITIGTEHVGGLYGDGNLTLVDGYRELHIDNYGTDYYSTDDEISKEQYENMSDRERAYFVLNYKAKIAISVTGRVNENDISIHINANERLSSDKFKETFAYDYYNTSGYPEAFKTYINADGTPNPEYFDELGFCSLYAGRLLNTIQRCDMCAVFGSRIVLQGARDRVPQKADYTRYTLNRVGELSLNQRSSEATDEAADNLTHGNYFGIYSVVNYLGNLTSDVSFDAVRQTSTSNENNQADGSTTYYQWKEAHATQGNRNNGKSANKVSLASGVYLELIRENTEKLRMEEGHEDDTEWGYITGVVELDLIDVKTGLGGGYVYARNEHGVKTWHGDWDKVNLSTYNLNARTYKRFTYDPTEGTMKVFETSGNFVHFTKQIIDDCYPNANAYKGSDRSPAHYWYIKGSIYVYDQYISAYTGAANAYSETVSIPLTISASSHGKLTLRDVKPNLYAYYGDNSEPLGQSSIIVNGITYKAGDPIDYWTYQMLSEVDQSHFVSEVYTTIAECTITTASGTVTYPEGHTMLPGNESNPAEGTYNYIRQYAPMKDLNPEDDDNTQVKYVHDTTEDKDVEFDFVFRPANNLAHNTGFVLTYDVNNPGVWDDYYTLRNTDDRATYVEAETTHYYPPIITKEVYTGLSDANKAKYILGPTYKAVASGVFGQRTYTTGEIITKSVVEHYPLSQVAGRTDQASVEQAYVVTSEVTVTNNAGIEKHLTPGAPVYSSDYPATTWASMSKSPAKVCTSTLEITDKDYVHAGDLLSESDYATLKGKIITKNGYTGTDEQKDALAEAFLSEYLDDAYYVTGDGLYGGAYYEANKSYLAIDAWCSMSETDRNNFRYNYDGLDLLIDDTYGGGYGFKPQYDGYMPLTTRVAINGGTAQPQYAGCTPLNPLNYSETTPIDFEAEFNPSTDHITYLGGNYDNENQRLKYKDEHNNDVYVGEGYENRISRDAFEDIPNERVHWSPIVVEAPGTYYVVKNNFIKGDIPYTVGQTIDVSIFNSLTPDQQTLYIDQIAFGATHVHQKEVNGVKQYEKDGVTPIYDKINYYYCREPYTIGEKGEGVGFTNLGVTSEVKTYAVGETVPQNVVIDEDNYEDLKNLQTGFIIHGTAPVETATLYVSRESDFHNLTKEKIITVIYEYDYQESDESGNNITPVCERHVVNIHINFESGAPQIGPLAPPSIVLPNSTIALVLPSREVGAFEITSSGWEMYTTEEDAKMHVNGKPYVNNETPMFWYQNGYWVAYYAQTYLGKTYSNAVQFSVANYHDLKKVMDAKEHHYYIDHKDVDRAPKIYIEDYSEANDNGLDLLKNLIDLSYVNKTYDLNGDPVPISGGTFDGHIPMEDRVRGGKGLEFILHSNQEYMGSWTPIAGEKNGSGDYLKCFEGNFHGDGHYIKGLDHSLFGKLCGNVYNTGVMGSFTSAGIADEGDGFVENCWTKSSATAMDAGIRAVFGNPSDVSDKDGKQIINCYYLNTNAYPVTTDYTGSRKPRGLARPMPEKAFYNGTVAYNLNGFYLKKRYYDGVGQSSGLRYEYYQPDDLEAITKTYHQGWYPTDYAYYPLEATTDKKLYGYVENRIADGDFIYQYNEIPETSNIRLYTDNEGKSHFYPIWPDDYLFFGQRLNYDYYDVTGEETVEELAQKKHEEVPSPVIRDIEENEQVVMTKLGNRVYRAPAYFRNGLMDVAHFNPYAIFAQTKKNDAEVIAYKGMTAIDFTGGNGDWSGGYQWDWTAGATANAPERFFAPLLDDGGLTGFVNEDLTQNLLVYTGTTEPAKNATYNVVDRYLNYVDYPDQVREPIFAELDTSDKPAKYRAVAALESFELSSIKGHQVVQDGDDYKAVVDHFLVDKQDFNAPISYTFDSSHRMWYQRTPDELDDQYVDIEWSNDPTPVRSTKGWEGVSLPFTAELVTTQDKGEITHFYNNSWTSKNDPSSGSKIGHEYWLRGFTGIGATNGLVVTANFDYPSNGTTDEDKDYTNTFLWDYYYSYHSYDDKNGDDYQEDENEDNSDYLTYYKNTRTHSAYAYLTKATPYIIGLPGERYYEFDLSGKFSPKNTAGWPSERNLEKQTISFVSSKGITIEVSDGEKAGVKPSGSAYTFKPSYLNNPELEEANTHAFLLNSDGNSYVEDAENTASAGVKAFRPYFTAVAASGGGDARPLTRTIIFSKNDDSELKGVEERDNPKDGTGSLNIYAKKHKIIVESALTYTTDVRIVNLAGMTINSFTIEPGETIETRVNTSGVYIVQPSEARFIKKLSVK